MVTLIALVLVLVLLLPARAVLKASATGLPPLTRYSATIVTPVDSGPPRPTDRDPGDTGGASP